MYTSLNQILVIYKIIMSRQDLADKVKAHETTGSFEDLDANLALYCYNSSRLFIQISQFLIESMLFKRLKFIYEGVDF